ncbi:MAG: hypothetical protein AAF721_04220 [Myxococcota bacterium]
MSPTVRHAARTLARALGIFALGWSLQTFADYQLRMRDGDVHSGGLPRDGWFVGHAVIAVTAVWAGWRGLAPLRETLRFALLAAVICAATPAYVVACLSYGIAAGIDYL